MKKWIALLLCFALTLSCAVAESTEQAGILESIGNWLKEQIESRHTLDESYASWLREQAQTMLDKEADVLSSKTYMSLMGAPDEVMRLSQLTFGRRPVKMTTMDIPRDTLQLGMLLGVYGMVAGDMNETVNTLLLRGLPNMLVTAMQGTFGTSMLAFSAISHVSECVLMPEDFCPAIVLIDVGAELCGVMTASEAGKGIVSLTISTMPRAVMDDHMFENEVTSLACGFETLIGE